MSAPRPTPRLRRWLQTTAACMAVALGAAPLRPPLEPASAPSLGSLREAFSASSPESSRTSPPLFPPATPEARPTPPAPSGPGTSNPKSAPKATPKSNPNSNPQPAPNPPPPGAPPVADDDATRVGQSGEKAGGAAAKPRSAAKAKDDDAAEAFFRAGRVPEITIELAPESVDSLRREPRTYARCTVREGGEVVSAVAGVKLKGSAGSFQSFDERPALTVHLDKFANKSPDKTADKTAHAKPRLHGLEKFHLNNSVQDPSLLSEWTAAAILREAGQPATRVAHARVRVNERDFGVYVLKESFDDAFLERNFKDAGGNLYDGGFCQDLDGELDRDEGPGAKLGAGDRADLGRIVEACRDPDMTARWKRLEELVDIPLFVRFMALEAMLAHWDGYSFNTNNYRVYFEPGRKARFLLHGMDQCFGDPGMSVLEHPRAMLAASVMRNPEWRKLYRRELERQLDEFDGRRLSRRIAPVVERLQKALEDHGFPGEAQREHAEHARGFVERVVARGQNLKAQSKEPEPKPLQFRAGTAVAITGWRPMSESEDARVEFADREGVAVLRVVAGESGDCVAGFRRGVLLSKGRYRLDGLAMLEGVRPRREPEPGALADEPAGGVGLRISGVRVAEPVLGDGERRLSLEFEVDEALADVELVVELRASAGTVEFRADSLRLTRLRTRSDG